MTRVTLIPHSQRHFLVDAVTSWGYPFDMSKYQDHIVILQIGEAIAYVWFEFFSESTGLLHGCADPEHRGRWLTRSVIEKIKHAAELFGFDELIISTQDQKVRNLCRKIGFFDDPGIEKIARLRL
jgi:GNAT superfamily N-acetyltransferase